MAAIADDNSSVFSDSTDSAGQASHASTHLPVDPSPNNGPSAPFPTTPHTLRTNPSGLGLLDERLSRVRRRKLDIINKLFHLGAQLDIDIPQIVVIGSQSAGKSSLIESISGITLPRSSGTCTRCPTECRLIQSDTPWECQVSLRFLTDNSGHTLQEVRNVSFGPPIQDPKDVEERIRNAQRAALNPDTDSRDFLGGNPSRLPLKNALDFTTNCVSLDIRGPDVADLSFCDLPGLIASVADGGREEDIDNVKELVESYIVKPSCIVLLTVACESDFETQGAHLLAKRHDPKGERTIGVLTKPDRISPGEEARWIKLIKNESSKLENGWYCVKQPSSIELREVGLTFREARRRGEAYFENPPWSTLDVKHRNKLGTQALTIKLNDYLMTMITKRFPELMVELQKVLQCTKDELQKLPAPAFTDPIMEVMHLIGEFNDDMFRHAEGITYSISGLPDAMGGNQFELIRTAHESFREIIRSTAPDFRPINSVHRVQASGMVEVVCESPALSEPSSVEPSFLNSEENTRSSHSGAPIYLDEVVKRVQRATTRELPGYFPFQVVQDLISSSTSQWAGPSLDLVESVYHIVFNHHVELIKLHFGKYTTGGLLRSVLRIMQEYTQKCRNEAIERVKWILELEAHAFTLNLHYLNDYRNKFLEYYTNHRQNYWHRNGQYYAHEPWNSDKYGVEIMATVRAYFQVAYKRVVDTLALTIDHELIRVKKRKVQEAISLGLGITGTEVRERCERFLAEPSEVVDRRNSLRSRLERLTNAQSELQMAWY